MSNTIKVVVKLPKEAAKVVENFENTLLSYRNAVDGYIESIPFPGREANIDIVMNDEGKTLHMDENIYVPDYNYVFVGPLVVVGVTENLTWRSLTDEEI